jgi:hypothetical protein
MRLISEFEPVQKYFLCFVQEFFNSRFGYGKTICQIIEAIQGFVDVELLVGPSDLPFFLEESARFQLSLEKVAIHGDSPGRSILAENTPIFAENDKGEGVGLIFEMPFLEERVYLKHYYERFTAGLGYQPIDIQFPFGTAHLAANDDLVLLSDAFFRGECRDSRLKFFVEHFPGQSFHVVPPLAGDVTNDLDMYLWPIAPKVWVVSEYPAHTPQADSIEPALRVLKEHNHTVHRVPGLPPIIYDDINTMPNYANGVIVNQAALVPAYQRKEDGVVAGILKGYGYQVFPIDCSTIILSNCGIHCITKTVPRGRER